LTDPRTIYSEINIYIYCNLCFGAYTFYCQIKKLFAPGSKYVFSSCLSVCMATLLSMYHCSCINILFLYVMWSFIVLIFLHTRLCQGSVHHFEAPLPATLDAVMTWLDSVLLGVTRPKSELWHFVCPVACFCLVNI